MPTYCFRCRNCGIRWEGDFAGKHCESPDVIRDYRAEGVTADVSNLRREREHSVHEYAAKFLPTNADFAGPGDPEGKKGMAKWREEHAPASSNKRPHWPGEVDRRSF